MKKREAPPPGWYGRSTGGTYFRICRTGQRSEAGEKLYRLEFYSLNTPVKGNGRWTLQELKDSGVRFLKRRPRCAP